MMPVFTRRFWERADAWLRSLLGPGPQDTTRSALRCLLTVLVGGALYGLVMGTFSGLSSDRWPQLVYSMVKVPILLLIAPMVAWPCYFVLNTLAGLRSDLRLATGLLMQAGAAMSVTLVSLSPLTLLWYASNDSYQAALLFNGVIFAVSALMAHLVLTRGYRPLMERSPRHRLLLRVWLLLHGMVSIQLAWVMRPFVGSPDSAPTFFRDDAWSNAFEVLLKLIRHAAL